jgi:hypothetical protein
MLSFIKKFFGSKPTVTPAPEVPYKVEAPQTTVGTVPMSTQYSAPAVEPEIAPKKKPASKKPAGEKTPAVRAKTTRAKKAS